tara:strand:+ start:4 stop:288 length:285 start_codon:yes stop_codon:yes gene_type:complete
MITKGKNIMTYKPKTLTVKISTVRDMTYKKIDALVKDIKDNTSMSDHFIEKVDINMKNAINKILNDYRYQEVNKKEDEEELGVWSEFASEGLGI